MEFSRPECWCEYRDLPNPGIKLRSLALQVDSLPAEPQGKPKNTGVGSLSLLQGIFPTQGINRGLLHCRRILYQLSYKGSHNYLLSTSLIMDVICDVSFCFLYVLLHLNFYLINFQAVFFSITSFQGPTSLYSPHFSV